MALFAWAQTVCTALNNASHISGNPASRTQLLHEHGCCTHHTTYDPQQGACEWAAHLVTWLSVLVPQLATGYGRTAFPPAIAVMQDKNTGILGDRWEHWAVARVVRSFPCPVPTVSMWHPVSIDARDLSHLTSFCPSLPCMCSAELLCSGSSGWQATHPLHTTSQLPYMFRTSTRPSHGCSLPLGLSRRMEPAIKQGRQGQVLVRR